MCGEGSGDRQQQVRVASVCEREGDRWVGMNRCGAWVVGVHCGPHNNGMGRGGQTTRSGEQPGGGVHALDAVDVAYHACWTWHQWHGCTSCAAAVVVGGSAQLAGPSHVTVMAGCSQVWRVGMNYD